MSKSNKKEPTKKYIAIDDLAHELGLLDSDVISWVAIDQPELTHDHRGRPCISTSYLDKYSQSKQYLRALRNSITAQVDESAARANQREQLRKDRKARQGEGERFTARASSTFVMRAFFWSASRRRKSMGSIAA